MRRSRRGREQVSYITCFILIMHWFSLLPCKTVFSYSTVLYYTYSLSLFIVHSEEEERRQDSGPSKVNHNIRKARTGSVISPRDQPRTNYAGNGAATSFRNSIVSPRDFTGRIASATAGILSPGSNKPSEAPYQPWTKPYLARWPRVRLLVLKGCAMKVTIHRSSYYYCDYLSFHCRSMSCRAE